ncbi:MAG: hypothetical protein WCD12_08450 [Candidatus Binatus sp.]
MTASELPQEHAFHRHRWAAESDIDNPDVPASGFGPLCSVEMESTGKSRFNGGTPLLFEQALDTVDRQPSSFQRDTFRLIRGQFVGEFVRPYDFFDY